jgi:hypothetical protein
VHATGVVPTRTVVVVCALFPCASVTVTVTVYVPAEAYVCVKVEVW